MKRVWLVGTMVLLLSVFGVAGSAFAAKDSGLPPGLAARCAEDSSQVPCSVVSRVFGSKGGDSAEDVPVNDNDGGGMSTMGAEGPGPWIK